MKSILKLAALGALLATSASAQTVINLTGSTAFRASTHAAILANLGASPTLAYSSSAANADKAGAVIFNGTFGGNPVIVRCYWSGSVAGIVDVGAQVPLAKWLPTTETTSAGSGTSGGTPTSTTPNAAGTPDGAMSDVFQSATTVTATLNDHKVAVVPFIFIANNGAPITNMTPQLFRTVYGGGYGTLNMFTGTPADNAYYVVGLGRDSGSGTRATAHAETGHGIFANTYNQTVTVSGGQIVSYASAGNSNAGYAKGSDLANGLAVPTADPASWGYFVGYVGIADKVAGNVELTYNGVPYSAQNVYEGKYTFWGYEHLFTPTRVSTASSGDDLVRKNFFDAMANSLKSNPGSAGLDPRLATDGVDPGPMKVFRNSDGGTVITAY